MDQEASSRSQSWTAVITAAALGAAAMYLSDPDRGRRRRALVKDKAKSVMIRTGDAIDVASRDLGNRMQGLRAQGKRLLARRNEQAADNNVVVARVRERLGRAVSHPHAIKVNAVQGRVILSGPVLTDEKDGLLEAVRSVPGVTEIDDLLTVHQSAEGVASLQGGRRLAQARSVLMQDNWPPAVRAIALLGGGALGYYGVARRSAVSTLAAVLGMGLIARGAINRPLLRSAGAMAQPLNLHKSIYIQAPPDAVFDLWTRYENFPHFMSNVQEVRDLGNGRSHWIVSGPAGTWVEWDSIITESRRPELMAWQTEPNASVDHHGRVRFEPADSGTRVTVDMSYSPPAGAVGQAFASLFNGSPKRQLDEDLMRMKQFIETGIQPHDAARRMQQRPDEVLH